LLFQGAHALGIDPLALGVTERDDRRQALLREKGAKKGRIYL
jgi:hypothetical protein